MKKLIKKIFLNFLKIENKEKIIKETYIREKNFLSKKKKQKRTDLTLGLTVRAKLYRQNLTQKHTHIHSQKKEKGKN